MSMKLGWRMMVATLAFAGAAWATDTYPVEAWAADSVFDALGGTSDDFTGVPYIAKGTNASSSPTLYVWQQRQVSRMAAAAAEANQLRVVKEATALRVGVYPGDYQMNGTRTHFAGASNQGSGSLTLGDDTYYVYVDNGNALQIVTDATGWPADESQFVPLAEVTVASGSVSSIVDRRGWSTRIVPQSGGAGISGTDTSYFIIDQDNGSTGVNSELRFNRGSSGADASLRWDEAGLFVGCYLDSPGNTLGLFKANQLQSAVSTGTAPLVVASTTKVSNLNADATDGVGFSAAPAAANGVCYSTSTSAAAFTAAATAGDVLYANGTAVPVWGAPGATSGVAAYDADLAAISALSSTGFPARTASDTWALRTITAGSSIAVTNGGGVAGNPTIAVAGATQYAVQVGASGGSLNSVSVGSSNTVLCGNSGANPGFRQIVNADVATGAAIGVAKISAPQGATCADGDVYISGSAMLVHPDIRTQTLGSIALSAGAETSNTITVSVSLMAWYDSPGTTISHSSVIKVWLADSTTDAALSGTACTSIAASGWPNISLISTQTAGKEWQFLVYQGVGNIAVEYTGGAKTWKMYVSCGDKVGVVTLAFT